MTACHRLRDSPHADYFGFNLHTPSVKQRLINSAGANSMKLMSGTSNESLAKAIADYLDAPLTASEIERFADGEIFVRIDENVRGEDVFVIQSTSCPANDHLMELLICTDALVRASARRITAVIPYFGYARQDRKTGGRTPISAKLVANLIVNAGANRVLTMDLHAAQIQGFFDVPVDHLYAAPILDQHFKSLNIPSDELVIVSPDEGSIKRSVHHQEHLGGTLAIVDKRRANALETRQANLIGGPIDGKTALIFDDMITTAGSICGAVDVARAHGAGRVYISASHGVFCGPAIRRINEAQVDGIVVTNSCLQASDSRLENLTVVSVAGLLGEAIRRVHRNESVSYLFD